MNGPVCRPVAGVSEQLVIPDAECVSGAGAGGGEDRHQWTDRPRIGRGVHVRTALDGDVFEGLEAARVAHLQLLPEKTPDAAHAVAPGKAASPKEFLRGVFVKTVLLNFLTNLFPAGHSDGRAAGLDFKKVQKGGGLVR